MKRATAAVLPGPVRRRLVHRELYWQMMPGTEHPMIAVVYGNCQAEPIRRMLASHPLIRDGFQLVRVPPVHEITPREVTLLRRLIPRTALFVAQHVRPDYRGLPIGTDQLAELLPKGAEFIRFPVAYFSAFYPFQVYVHEGDNPLGVSAPVTDYHDLRILWAAAKGWTAAETARRVRLMSLDPDWVAHKAEASMWELESREKRISDAGPAALVSPEVKERPMESFHTINHPSNRVLLSVAQQVAGHLGISPGSVRAPEREVFGHLVAPREAAVATVLGEPTESCWESWRTPKGTYTFEEVAARHLRFYRDAGRVLADGLIEHDAALHDMRPMWS